MAETKSAAVITEPKSDNPEHKATEIVAQIAESAEEAGYFRFLGEYFEIDRNHQDITDQIRKLADPRYVPVLCKRIYRSPAGTEIVMTYHVIGKYIPEPTEGYEDQYITLSSFPSDFPFPPDKIQTLRTLWAPWDTRDEKGKWLHPVEYNNGYPPAPVQIGPWLVEQMCAVRKYFDAQIRIENGEVKQGDFESDKRKEILEAETLADAKRFEKSREEQRYRVHHNWRQFKDALDNGRMDLKPEEPPLFLDLGKKG